MHRASRDKSMWRLLVPILLASAAACGARNDKAVAQLTLTSPAFQNGQAIPRQFTCDGANQSPPLAWGEPPAGTRRFALVVDDPDAPGATFRHWGAYDIPASVRSIGVGQALGAQAVNDMDKPGYGGPCPPKGHGPHHYRFKLFALDAERLGLSNPKIADLETAAQSHALAKGELTGVYERN